MIRISKGFFNLLDDSRKRLVGLSTSFIIFIVTACAIDSITVISAKAKLFLRISDGLALVCFILIILFLERSKIKRQFS